MNQAIVDRAIEALTKIGAAEVQPNAATPTDNKTHTMSTREPQQPRDASSTRGAATSSAAPCWHCTGKGCCGCTACWRRFAGEVAECVVCRGTGKAGERVQ